MQKLIEHISELLYLHDCVVIPDFGGFICNQKCAEIHEKSGMILPPKKDILFNRNLTHNDGLLINWMVQRENISYEKAATQVALFCEELKVRLYQKEHIAFGEIGTFYLDRQFHIIFEPTQHNFLAEAYGMDALHIQLPKEPKANETPCINLEHSNNILHRFLKYGLTAAAIAGVVLVTQLDIYPQAKKQWNKMMNYTTFQPEISLHVSDFDKKITCNSIISPTQDYVDYDPLNDLN